MSSSSVIRSLVAAIALSALLGACGAAPGAVATPSPSSLASATTIDVRDAWARPAPAGADTAAYFTITNRGGDDRLIGIHATIAGSCAIHHTSTDASGMTGMSMAADLPVPAGGTVMLEPGGTHVMLTGLTAALSAGATIQLDLTFEHAGVIHVSTAIRQG